MTLAGWQVSTEDLEKAYDHAFKICLNINTGNKR